MNIFALDKNPCTAAKYHCDKHVVKMVVEAVQMLSNTLHFLDLPAPYKKTHWNHPCSHWTRESLQNYRWLWNLADYLGKEYTYRYNKIHKSHEILRKKIPKKVPLPKIGLTTFVNATPYKEIKNPIKAYKTYYQKDKSYFATWKKRRKPCWFN